MSIADDIIPGLGVVKSALDATGAVVRLTEDEIAYLNSPQMLSARKARAEAEMVSKDDADLAAAQKTGDISKIDKDDSG